MLAIGISLILAFLGGVVVRLFGGSWSLTSGIAIFVLLFSFFGLSLVIVGNSSKRGIRK